jgi:hypothetical protein
MTIKLGTRNRISSSVKTPVNNVFDVKNASACSGCRPEWSLPLPYFLLVTVATTPINSVLGCEAISNTNMHF